MTQSPIWSDLARQASDSAEEPVARLFAAASLLAEIERVLPDLLEVAQRAGHPYLNMEMVRSATRATVAAERAEHDPESRELEGSAGEYSIASTCHLGDASSNAPG